MYTQLKQSKGFTIIEVVLVLAIAALIFLMVFVALPALQESQRDTARKNDASVVAGAVQNFMSAERRALTTDTDDRDALRGYVDELSQYESGDISIQDPAEGEVTDLSSDQIRVYLETKCNGTQLEEGVSRSAAVMVLLEGGNDTNYCVDV